MRFIENLFQAPTVCNVSGNTDSSGDGGVRFALWAPNARRVSVSGDFNGWRPQRLDPRGTTGVWEGVVRGAKPGDHYKYELIDYEGAKREKSDPFGFRMEVRPKTASLVWPLQGHEWQDGEWVRERGRRQNPDAPMRIYEVHLGSWRKGGTYRDLAKELVETASGMGFTHVEMVPAMEDHNDATWG